MTLRIRKKSQTGIVLIGAIMLIIFASVAVLSVTSFLIEQQRLIDEKKDGAQLIEAAFAGINGAVYSYRFRDLSGNGYFSLGQFNIDADHYFVLGGSAGDFFMVDTSNADLSNNGRDVQNVVIQNANNSQPVTIDRMIITWDNSQNLDSIRIGNSNVWNGNLPSPADANISNYTLNTTPSSYPITRIRFRGNMNGATISVQFVMTDSSTRTVTVYPASSQFNFTVNATGKITGANRFRTIEAEYNALTGRVVSYQETSEEFTP